MSYFFELPNFDDAGLGLVWDGMDVVARRIIQNGDFHIAAPMEFRFIKAGDSAMSGAYSDESRCDLRQSRPNRLHRSHALG